MDITLHGTFLKFKFKELGVLITGPSGIGKSELALALINKGHKLIADDCVIFKCDPDLVGTCPPLLQDLLEIRDIGVLNIRHLFGNEAIALSAQLKLIIHLRRFTKKQFASLPRLTNSFSQQIIRHQKIPEFTLAVLAERDLCLLTECLVKNFILQTNGQDSTQEFILKQKEMMWVDQG